MTNSRTRIVVAIATIGRIERIGQLLHSLDDQLTAEDVVAVAVQGNWLRVSEFLKGYEFRSGAEIVYLQSEGGAAKGRNDAVSAVGPRGDEILLFPNDSSLFPPGALQNLDQAMRGFTAGGMEVLVNGEPRFVIRHDVELDRKSVWRVIEPGLVMRASTFQALRGFDSNIGTGATTPWQAGEAADLLLRYIALGLSRFRWIEKETAFVEGLAETDGLRARERRQKVRAYGRGVAYVYRLHRFPSRERLRLLFAGLAIGIRRREEYLIVDGLWAFVGRLEGSFAFLLSKKDIRAVTR